MAIQLSKPITRKVTTTDGRALFVTLTLSGIEIREMRAPTYLLPYGAAHTRAVAYAIARDIEAVDRQKPLPARRVKRGLL